MSTATVSLVEIAAEWRTARRLYPFYSALIREFGLNIPHCKELETPVDRSDREVLDRIHKWFAGVDGQVQVAQIRQLLQSQRFGEEESLRALLLRHLPQDQKDENLRDKLDYLLVQYFAAIAPHHPHDGDVTSSEVREALRPVLGHVDLGDVPFVKELDTIADAVDRCLTLAELLDSGLVELGRNAKRGLGKRYFDPASLVEITRFNFRLRLGFFRLMHSDLHAIRKAVQELEAIGVISVDCREAGLGSAEPLATLRTLCHHWKKPFREAYRAGQSFRQLGLVRKILTSTVIAQCARKTRASQDASAVDAGPAIAAPPAAVPGGVNDDHLEDSRPGSLEQILESISEQLFASKQKSMVSTVTLPHSKQLLSSWEVNAFIRGGDPSCRGIQRAVAARSFVAESAAKAREGDSNNVRAALQCAHVEAALIQEEVAKAKDRGDIDAAVSLAATSKRLLAVIDETEKLKA